MINFRIDGLYLVFDTGEIKVRPDEVDRLVRMWTAAGDADIEEDSPKDLTWHRDTDSN